MTPASGSDGWQSIDLITPVEVLSGEQIWLAWNYQYAATIRYKSGSPGRADSQQGWSSGMPSGFGSSSVASYVYSIYMTYIPGNSGLKNKNSDPLPGFDPSMIHFTDIFIYPNPFNSELHINYSLIADMNIQIDIYSLLGDKIYTVKEGYFESGVNGETFNVADFAGGKLHPGIYLLRFQAGKYVQTIKIIAR